MTHVSLLLTGISFLLVVSITLVLRNDSAREQSGTGISPFNLGGVDYGDPTRPIFIQGRQTTLEAAEREFANHIYRPQHELASDSSLQEVWVGTTGQPEVGLKYGSGIRVYLALWPASRVGDAEAAYRADAVESPYVTYEEVDGRPAIVVPAGAQVAGADGVVSVTFGRIEVSIYGQLDQAELIEVARTLR